MNATILESNTRYYYNGPLLPNGTLVRRFDFVAEMVGHDLVDERVPGDDGRGVRQTAFPNVNPEQRIVILLLSPFLPQKCESCIPS